MNKEQERISFRWQPNKKTRDGILAEYLKTSPSLSAKEQIVQTTRMCWLPIALSEAGGCDPATLEKLARRSVRELQQQIQRICQTVNLTNDVSFYQPLSSSLSNDLDLENDEFDEEKDYLIGDFGM